MSEADKSMEISALDKNSVEYKREYMNAYNKARKDDEYYVLTKRLNNKISYLRKNGRFTDSDEEYREWKILYPELVSLKETLQNIKIIMEHNEAYSHLGNKLRELIDDLIIR